MNENTFPSNNYKVDMQNIQIQTYGQRLYKDQSFYEYLLEFLLVFISKKGTKTNISEEGFSFPIHLANEKLAYNLVPNMGLKRFIFLNRSEPDKRFKVDTEALEDHRAHMKKRINVSNNTINEDFIVDVLQDLLYGFNAIIGKRSWFAQALLPVAPELIFCEAIGSKKTREILTYEPGAKDVDYSFEFNGRYFMARGGEVYYLHVLQGLVEKGEYKDELERHLKTLINSVPQLSKISEFIQGTWEDYHYSGDNQKEIQKTMEWIPDNYKERSSFTIIELKNLLSSLINPLEMIDLLGSLIILQIMRMMSLQASKLLKNEDDLVWIIDLTDDPTGQVRKIAASQYSKVEEDVFRAVHTADIDSYIAASSKLKDKPREMVEPKLYEDASKDTNRLIRKLGKDIGFIVPPKGANMRFSLNEELVKLLVITLIEPGERILLNTFLEKCYDHFKMIIGPKQAKVFWEENKDVDVSPFNKNLDKFQQMLKDCGFLRDLSDATSIVENPFKG
ncbi:hypothetical protein [Rossellomorea sp. y25]|uniref:hypothetical protein n=1 Tax=Rossellomorea sp. y25 TaxID=3118174 RepID=UPI0030E26B84